LRREAADERDARRAPSRNMRRRSLRGYQEEAAIDEQNGGVRAVFGGLISRVFPLPCISICQNFYLLFFWWIYYWIFCL
jgi:hypothetical protein